PPGRLRRDPRAVPRKSQPAEHQAPPFRGRGWGEGNPGALRLPGLRHVARIRPKAASGTDTRITCAKTPALLRRPRPWRPSLSSAPPAPRPFPREAAFEDMRAGGARACPLTQRERGTRVPFASPGYDT